MSDLDWTFDSIPAEDESTPAQPAPPAPRRPWPRWLLIALLVGAVGLALGAYSFTRLGWSRLRAQVAAAVALEDERSAAQDVAGVRALQAEGYAGWLAQREAETGLGLPAPLPAGNLLPSGARPRVVAFENMRADVFVATVVRQYADSAGQTYDFELTQYYRHLGPGQWERLPTQDLVLHNTTVFASDHLSVTFPVADLPWLAVALPQIEASLARACLAWRCPDGLRLNVSFGGQMSALDGVLRAARPAGPAYPIVFDLPPRWASQPGRYRLPSPQITGYPHDERAAAALTRATTVQLLAALASEIAQDNRRSPDYFLDALVARAEIRLGLSPALAPAVTPYEYISPAMLWSMSGQGAAAAVTDSLALRRQALGFVDFALAGQPAAVDGDLLHQLRLRGNLTLWLGDALDEGAGQAAARWRTAVLGQWSAAPQAGYTGQVLVCGQHTLVVGADGLHSVSSRPQGQQFISAQLSPDGRTLAGLILGRSTTKLVLFDLANGTLQPLPVAQPAAVLGWLPNGALLYLEVHPANGASSVWRLMRLRQYDPAARAFSTVLPEPVVLPWSERGLWSPDHRTLGLAVFRHGAGAPPELVLITPGDPLLTRVLPTAGYAPAFSPRGDRLAVFSGPYPFGGIAGESGWRLNLIDLEQQQLLTLLTAADLGLQGYSEVGGLDWSADGRWLSFFQLGGSTTIAYLAAADGGQQRRLDVGLRNAGAFPLGFSPDSRYLAVMVIGGLAGTNEVVVFDLAAPAEVAPQRYLAQTAAWAAAGHSLLMGGPAGVFAVDPATNEFHWLYDTTCAAEIN